MPYSIRKIGPPSKPYCVISPSGNRGCHRTRRKAHIQIGVIKKKTGERRRRVRSKRGRR